MSSASDDVPNLEIPPECVALKAAHKASGLTVADLAAATGLSVASIHIALNGVRYRDGEAKATVPPDGTLVKLSSMLGVTPDMLREHGRARAAGLLETEVSEAVTFDSDREAQAAVHGRAVLAKQVLAAFSVEELEAEVQRRRLEDQKDHQG